MSVAPLHPQLTAQGAPRKVLEAAEEIDEFTEASLRPPKELVAFVNTWLTNRRSNDRYGH